MKLLYCTDCHSIFNLRFEVKTCSCGKVSGAYSDVDNAWYSGETAVPLGISNVSMMCAHVVWAALGNNPEFTAFFIPKECKTFVRR